MGVDFKLPQHGRDHARFGSDPIPGLGDGLRYDTDNEGGWFFAAANDTTESGGAPSIGYTDGAGNTYTSGFSWQFDTGSSDAPFAITNDGGFVVDTAGDAEMFVGSTFHINGGALDVGMISTIGIRTSDGSHGLTLAVTGADACSIEMAHGQITALADAEFDVTAGTTMTFQTGSGGISITPAAELSMAPGGSVEVVLTAAQTFTLKDHLGNPKVQWTEGTTDLHIPTGGTIVADL